MLILSLLLACTSAPSDTGDPVFTPDLPLVTCGGPDHAWLPADEDLGRIVDYEYMPELSLEASAISALLEAAGIDYFSPVYDVKAYRVRYLTQDRGQLTETTGFISFPDLAAGEELESVSLMWSHGTSGFTDECAPTAMGLEGGAFNVAFSSIGYAVVAPDYLGMNGWGEPAEFLHPYLAPEPTALASLDGLRALWRFADDTGRQVDVDLSKRTLLWGGSEGGFAALWADRYASGYLPEAELVATVALVPPTDMLGLAQHAVTTFGPPTGALVAHYATVHPWYGATGDLSQAIQDPIASRVAEVLGSECGDGDLFDDIHEIAQVYPQDFISALQSGDLDAAAPFSCYLTAATLRETAIPRDHDTPVLFQVSEDDDLVVGSIERADFPRLCDAGYRAEYVECDGANHTQGAVESLPYQIRWVEARLRGEPLAEESTCAQGAPVDCSTL